MKTLLFTLLLFAQLAHAQTLTLQESSEATYIQGAGSPSGSFYVSRNGFALDKEGNRYETGWYRGNYDLKLKPIRLKKTL